MSRIESILSRADEMFFDADEKIRNGQIVEAKDKIYNEFGIMYELRGDYLKAIDYYKKAINASLTEKDIDIYRESINRCMTKKEILQSTF
ncbi:MAG: tetratricopeptide repeat protein [Myxococcota bacterium]